MTNVYPQQTPYVTFQPAIQTTNPFVQGRNEWHSGLCDCCNNVSDCCCAYWCWCCFVGSLAGSIGESKWSCFCVPYSLAMYRMKVRTALNIRGSTCSDHCATTCCGFCVGLQMRNELRYRGLS